MGTKVGLIVEGPIDEALLPPILNQIAQQRVGYSWPVIPDDLGQILMTRSRGHGGVLSKVKELVGYLNEYPPQEHAFFVILLDRKTRAVHEEIRGLVAGNDRFVLGVAIEEIEAWWLADKQNLLAFLEISDEHCRNTRFGNAQYNPESDSDPKVTLDELTKVSQKLSQTYGSGNSSLADEFAREYWYGRVALDAILQRCPRGFHPFCNVVEQSLRTEISRQKTLASTRGSVPDRPTDAR